MNKLTNSLTLNKYELLQPLTSSQNLKTSTTYSKHIHSSSDNINIPTKSTLPSSTLTVSLNQSLQKLDQTFIRVNSLKREYKSISKLTQQNEQDLLLLQNKLKILSYNKERTLSSQKVSINKERRNKLMAKNFLINALRENNPKSTMFNCDASVISYKTGFPILDYYLGYKVNVYDDNDQVVEQYPCIGISAGCFVTAIGKPSTGKTTMMVQIASNIVRDFDNGTVIHYDLEKALNYSRIQVLSRFKMKDMSEKYILKQEKTSIQDIKSAIMQIYKEKTSHPEIYKYDTGKKNEFGENIWIYEPTCVIIDSIPMLSTHINENDKKEAAKLEEISSQTDRMRLTGEIGRFYSELQQYIREANIIVFSINQIKTNPNMGIVKSPSEILYLSQDEALFFTR